VHGTVYTKSGIIYVPLYHPAAALHREELRQTMVEDMRKLRAMLVRELAGVRAGSGGVIAQA
jgi:uracil-DNA glycosylase